MPLSPRVIRRLSSALAIVALAPAGAIAQQPATPPAPSADSIRVAVNRVFAPWTATDGPGCAVAVARDGRVVHQNGYGMANLETGTPITPASVFHLASVSKQFTAAAVLLLTREGKLSLDDDIRKHLPELPDYKHRITIRHLLHHTSGLRDQWDLLGMARGRFEENRITEGDVLEMATRQKSLNFTPGSEYLYSNTGYTLAGIIVRRVSGKSLRDFAEERFFRPLGMTQTQFQDDYTRVITNRAAGYARRPATGRWHVSLPNYDTYGATSLFSTVGDLLKWQANMVRPTVGDSALFAEMQRLPTLTNGDTSAYGLGLAAERHRGAAIVSHGGADAGYRTWLGRFPEYALDVVVLCNAASSNPAALARSVADVFLPASLAAAPPPPMPARVAVAPEVLRTLSGLYVNTRTGAVNFIGLRGDTLIAGRTAGPALVPVGERRFRVGQQGEFEFMPDGTVRQHSFGWPPRAPDVWRRAEEAKPSAAELAAYAGTYYSEELGTTYTVTATDSTLVLKTRWANDVTVRPTYRDAFAGPYTVTFTRTRGKVDGMAFSSGRVRGVRFVKAR